MNIKVGTCGYKFYKPVGDWRREYHSLLQVYSNFFEALELNSTFYQLPRLKTVEKWKNEVVDDFEFTLKAWQAITHKTNSPTWRKKDDLSENQLRNYGFFQPNDDVFDAWEKTRTVAEKLHVKVIVFQTPSVFKPTEENERNIREFFNVINRKGFELAWEPRGDWNQKPSKIKEICDDLGLIHVVDIMRRNPVSGHKTAYIRLHGLNKKEYDYNYSYSKDEIEEIGEKIKVLADVKDKVYCFTYFLNFIL